MRIRDWSSDVCSSDLRLHEFRIAVGRTAIATAPRCVVGDGVALLQMLDVADRVSQPSFSCRALIDDPATAISRRPAGDALRPRNRLLRGGVKLRVGTQYLVYQHLRWEELGGGKECLRWCRFRWW